MKMGVVRALIVAEVNWCGYWLVVEVLWDSGGSGADCDSIDCRSNSAQSPFKGAGDLAICGSQPGRAGYSKWPRCDSLQLRPSVGM
eukprot:3309458-Pleurochrysis_carterae.AAC.1